MDLIYKTLIEHNGRIDDKFLEYFLQKVNEDFQAKMKHYRS